MADTVLRDSLTTGIVLLVLCSSYYYAQRRYDPWFDRRTRLSLILFVFWVVLTDFDYSPLRGELFPRLRWVYGAVSAIWLVVLANMILTTKVRGTRIPDSAAPPDKSAPDDDVGRADKPEARP